MDILARQSQSQASFQQMRNHMEVVMGTTKKKLPKHS